MTELPEVTVHGHFGEWIQGRAGPDGPLTLVTMRCPALAVSSSAGQGAPLLFEPSALRRFATLLELPVPARWPGLSRSMPPGAGAGASTATLVALARALGFAGAPERLAQACVAIEGASDPLMFDAPDQLIWQSRTATIRHRTAPPPVCEIVGGFWGQPERTDPADMNFADVADLLQLWQKATAAADLAGCADLASRSAERCTSLRGPGDPLPELARTLGALGHVRAHTGSARGLIFAPGTVPPQAPEALSRAGLTGVLRFCTGAVA